MPQPLLESDKRKGFLRLNLYVQERLVSSLSLLKFQVVNWALNELQLSLYADEVSSSYSGGNKRKLSVAIALVADPPLLLLVSSVSCKQLLMPSLLQSLQITVLFQKLLREGSNQCTGRKVMKKTGTSFGPDVPLFAFNNLLKDEPSAGMDPSTQRFLWNVLLQLRRSKRAMVITSHSMEECEVLCNRVAIMNQGQLKCIGPIQHLKHRSVIFIGCSRVAPL